MGSAVVPATITLRRGRRGRKGSKAEETTESGNAQCILTIFMKFEHLYKSLLKNISMDSKNLELALWICIRGQSMLQKIGIGKRIHEQ